MISVHHKALLIDGRICKVTCAIQFNPKAALDLLAPLAVHSPDRMVTECDGVVSLKVIDIEVVS